MKEILDKIKQKERIKYETLEKIFMVYVRKMFLI